MARGRLIDKVGLDGFDELSAALRDLSRTVQRNVVTRALVKAGEPVVVAAKQAAPVDSGDLKEAIIASSSADHGRRSKGDVSYAYIGPSYSKFDANYAPHGHLVEFGTAARYHKNGKYVGQAPAQPFLRPAWDSQKQSVISNFTVTLRSEIEKAVARAERKQRRIELGAKR